MDEVVWFEQGRIPAGRTWPFLTATWHSLRMVRDGLPSDLDMTEGQGALTTTGCMQAYRQAVLRRVLDLAQSTVLLWNRGFATGAVVSARGLLETLAIYHALLRRAETIAAEKDWERLSTLVSNYAFSRTDDGRGRKSKKGGPADPDTPPSIGRAVRAFVAEAEPGQELFWDQICDTAHPNEFRTMEMAGTLEDVRFRERPAAQVEVAYFPVIYNALYSCCWLVSANLDYEILLEVVRNGGPLPEDHPLILERGEMENLVAKVTTELGSDAERPGVL